VPPWLAGKWEADEQTQTSRLFYKTGITDNKPYSKQAITTVTRGSQRDRLGGLWDCIVLPEFRQVITEKELNNSVFSEQNIIFDSDARVIVRYVYTRTNVDKTTNTIRSVDQVEQFTTYCLNGPDRIRIEFSSKTFDHGGNPIDLAKGWMIAHKVNQFMVSNSDRNNQDVRPAFREFLKSSGMENLVPLEQ
jgi:hypothetical protein